MYVLVCDGNDENDRVQGYRYICFKRGIYKFRRRYQKRRNLSCTSFLWAHIERTYLLKGLFIYLFILRFFYTGWFRIFEVFGVQEIFVKNSEETEDLFGVNITLKISEMCLNPLTVIVAYLLHWQNSFFFKCLLQFPSKNSGIV